MSSVLPPALDLASGTHIGQRRSVNQDQAATLKDPNGRFALAIVCDGIGGLALGEVASRKVVDTVERAMSECPGDPHGCLDKAIKDANRDILEASSWWQRMGTTAVAILCTEFGFEAVHAGDSRAYLYRSGRLQPLTTDHSWVMEQVQAGLMTPEEAERDSRRNVITRAVGTEEALSLEWRAREPLEPGDVLFACSDGLHGPVPAEEIEDTVASANDATEAVALLIERANEHGGPDNVAVAMARVPA